jgi:hypothetical protein
MSVLMVKVVQLEECDIYMTKIIEKACEQLQCKLPGAPSVFVIVSCFDLFGLLLPRYLRGSCC